MSKSYFELAMGVVVAVASIAIAGAVLWSGWTAGTFVAGFVGGNIGIVVGLIAGTMTVSVLATPAIWLFVAVIGIVFGGTALAFDVKGKVFDHD